ncbi:putative Mg2+ transporter protein, CorA-like/Zinc transport protein ZntB [Septoria linicola]|nr:putative Mg2+ transporter protein, CorA-like/Zinc transport protein ZntB [Septoria linicola]
MTFSFLRARHYHDEASWNEAERQSGMFNVLRRLDSDRCRVRLHRWDSPSAGVALARSKVAMWSPQSSEASPRIVMILVDPTTTTGEQVWAGLGEGYGPLSMHDVSAAEKDTYVELSLLDKVVSASTHFTPDDLRRIAHDTRFAGAPMINIVLREWLRVTQYMDTVLGNLLAEFEKPHWGEHAPELDHFMKKLSPWQRNILNYRGMVDSSLSCLSASPHFDSSRPHDEFRKALQPDFERAAKRLQQIQHRIETMADVFSSMTAIEDARRATLAAEQSIGLTFLSILATIFLPLNFVTSFFSMSSDLSLSNSTFGLFFIFGIPLTLATVFIVGRSQDSVGTWLRESRRAVWKWISWNRVVDSKSRARTIGQSRTVNSNRFKNIPCRSGLVQQDTTNISPLPRSTASHPEHSHESVDQAHSSRESSGNVSEFPARTLQESLEPRSALV